METKFQEEPENWLKAIGQTSDGSQPKFGGKKVNFV